MIMSRKTKAANNCFDFAANVRTVRDITEQHVQRVYRLDSDVCRSKTNKNCTQNIRCLNGLGEKPWLTQPSSDSSTAAANVDDVDPDLDLGKRADNSFVGLKNLGATCYVNCLLQVWFHNPIFRSLIYRWNPDHDEDEIRLNQLTASDDLPDNGNDEDFEPKTCIGKLQVIFALMQFGVRNSVDPKPIIDCLELDANRQQDAHEFSNLFFSLVEKKLQSQRDDGVRNVIKSQYCGKYAYITSCRTCESQSSRESQFYELDLNIKGCKDISESLNQYLKVENLEGPNQYYCGRCGQKRDAIRYIELRQLPPVLNIQLLRFVFEPRIRKLNSFFKFPDVLDLRPYLKSADSLTPQQTTYHLSAVLIHRGPSANSGHYIAHIRDEKTGFWFKFNDESVEQIEGKKLKLDSDDIIVNDENKEINGGNGGSTTTSSSSSGSGNTTSSTTAKNDKKENNVIHNSNNAYMLVYKNELQRNADLSADCNNWGLPDYLIKSVDRDRQLFEESIAEQKMLKKEEMILFTKRKMEIQEIYNDLLATTDRRPHEFISKKWLMQWLSAKPTEQIQPVNNNDLVCRHGKLDFKCLSSIKCIAKSGADRLYDRYGGGPRIGSDSLCMDCVAKQVELIQVKAKIDEDIKLITSQLKFTVHQTDDAFWVGKDSLKQWKQMKLKLVECNNNTNNNDNEKNDISDSSVEVIDNNNDSDNSDNLIGFNDDIICVHGQLTTDDNKRRLVSRLVWQTLKSHFPDAHQFTSDSLVCEQCNLLNLEHEHLKSQHKEMATIQKLRLPHLSAERHRLLWDELEIAQRYYALSRKFLISWKKFVNDPSRNSPPEAIDNSGLLCAHQRFLYPTYSEIIGTDSKFVIVTNEEWDALNTFYSCDSTIEFFLIDDIENNMRSIMSIPEFCESCYQSLCLQQERDRLTYKNQPIYVRKVENNESNSEEDSHGNQEISGDSYHLKTNGKKLKTEETNGVTNTIQTNHQQMAGLRRSSRRRKNKNEKEIKVSSTDSLLDLKVQIMNIFKVATYDQHLSLNSRPLETYNNSKTLAELHVEPFSLITLTVDEEPSNECTLIDDDYIKGAVPEIGFKGTQLQLH
ncbi:ubiquitin carboxyl-terminal hydrolase 48-like [Oppia nitens]|uniref:ubiquitin carboxyl-terminal hydrolase 48-like n=1 Tax=Oppia nitens TaxID=1686743 RepID=UPI0023DCD128|nr:ubiquitin carboxyl-terminal hydrolase 48-like [Oppia nitens]